MRLLALDSATFTASVALLDDDRVVFADDVRATTASEELLPLIARGLEAVGWSPRDLGAIACGAGPGSFTGLRIGLATAKGLCAALGCPLHLVSSLAALAKDAGSDGPVLAVLDARRKEVFAGLYGPGGPLKDEAVLAPDGLAAYSVAGAVVVGDGAVTYPEAAAAAGTVRLDLRQTPSAASVGLLARVTAPVNLAAAAPTYLRGADAIAKPPRPPGSRRRPPP